jgi:hypothetical protein
VSFSRRLALACGLSGLATGCGLAHLQTAKTLPSGTTRTITGGTVVTSDLDNARRVASMPPTSIRPNFPLPVHLEVRHGVSDRVDLGWRLLWGLGAAADVKVNLLPPESRAALALSGGIGGAWWLNNDGFYVLQVPATLTASVEVAPWFTPYAAAGYRALWQWGRDDPLMPGSQDTSPRGPGEGWVAVYAGIELRRASGRAVMFESGRVIPVVHDSGHAYWMAPSHLFSIPVAAAP